MQYAKNMQTAIRVCIAYMLCFMHFKQVCLYAMLMLYANKILGFTNRRSCFKLLSIVRFQDIIQYFEFILLKKARM
jgi:hypothetical protein